MAFRSEREALKHRVDSMERELEDARAASAADLDRREQEIAQLKRDLEGMPPDRPTKLPLVFALVGLMVAGAGAFIALRASPAPEPAPPRAVLPVEQPTPPPPPAPVELPPVAPQPEPPPTPQADRAQIAAAFRAIQPEIRRCWRGEQSGRAQARVKFSAATGRVTTAEIDGEGFAGTPVGACMTRALREMHVEPFGEGEVSVSYPFVFRTSD